MISGHWHSSSKVPNGFRKLIEVQKVYLQVKGGSRARRCDGLEVQETMMQNKQVYKTASESHPGIL